MSAVDIRAVLATEAKKAGGQAEWGRRNAFSPTMVSLVLSGRKPASPRMAKALGYERHQVCGYVFTRISECASNMEIERSREDDGDE